MPNVHKLYMKLVAHYCDDGLVYASTKWIHLWTSSRLSISYLCILWSWSIFIFFKRLHLNSDLFRKWPSEQLPAVLKPSSVLGISGMRFFSIWKYLLLSLIGKYCGKISFLCLCFGYHRIWKWITGVWAEIRKHRCKVSASLCTQIIAHAIS